MPLPLWSPLAIEQVAITTGSVDEEVSGGWKALVTVLLKRHQPDPCIRWHNTQDVVRVMDPDPERAGVLQQCPFPAGDWKHVGRPTGHDRLSLIGLRVSHRRSNGVGAIGVRRDALLDGNRLGHIDADRLGPGDDMRRRRGDFLPHARRVTGDQMHL